MTRLEMQNYVLNFLQVNASGAGAGNWSASQIQQFIRDAELKVFAIVADKHENFFSLSTTLSETANAGTVDLPTNLYRVLYIERIVGNGATTTNPVQMHPIDSNVTQIRMARGMNWPFVDTANSPYPSYYMMHGQKQIELFPAPTQSNSNSLRLWYVFRPAAMASDSDVPFQATAGAGGSGKDNLSEFHDIIPMYALEKCLLMEESYPQMDRVTGMRRERERELVDYLNKMQVQAPRGIHVTADEWSW